MALTNFIFKRIPKTADEAIEKGKKKQQLRNQKNNTNGKSDNTVMFIFIFLFIIVIVAKFVLNPVVISGSSMEPTLHNGEIHLSDRNVTKDKLKYGVIVVFDSHEGLFKNFIKRIEGIPGDVIQIKDGLLYRNGELIDEGFAKMNDAGTFSEETVLGDDEYFVLGDNRNNSNDSRFLGAISIKDMKAIVNENNFF